MDEGLGAELPRAPLPAGAPGAQALPPAHGRLPKAGRHAEVQGPGVIEGFGA